MTTITAHSLGEQVEPTFTDYCTNFLFDCCLLLHGHTLCNIIKQGNVVVFWCVCVSICVFLWGFFLLSWARFLKFFGYLLVPHRSLFIPFLHLHLPFTILLADSLLPNGAFPKYFLSLFRTTTIFTLFTLTSIF